MRHTGVSLEETFTTGPAARVTVTTGPGVVTVTGWEAPLVKVIALKRRPNGWWGGRIFDQTAVRLDHDRQTVTVVTEDGSGRPARPLLGPALAPVEYTLFVPRRSHLQVRTTSARLALEDLTGDLQAETVSGPVWLSRLSGALNLRTVSGTVSGAHLTGDLAVWTVSGSVDLQPVHLRLLDLKTISGRLAVALAPDPGAQVRLWSITGPVRLALPAVGPLQVEGWGALRPAVALAGARLTTTQVGWRLQRGGNGPRCQVISLLGPVVLTTDPTLLPARPEPVALAAPDRLAILQAVARGELSVDEALARLIGQEEER